MSAKEMAQKNQWPVRHDDWAATEALMEEFAEQEARSYAAWLFNQVIAGRTANSLWLDYRAKVLDQRPNSGPALMAAAAPFLSSSEDGARQVPASQFEAPIAQYVVVKSSRAYEGGPGYGSLTFVQYEAARDNAADLTALNPIGFHVEVYYPRPPETVLAELRKANLRAASPSAAVLVGEGDGLNEELLAELMIKARDMRAVAGVRMPGKTAVAELFNLQKWVAEFGGTWDKALPHLQAAAHLSAPAAPLPVVGEGAAKVLTEGRLRRLALQIEFFEDAKWVLPLSMEVDKEGWYEIQDADKAKVCLVGNDSMSEAAASFFVDFANHAKPLLAAARASFSLISGGPAQPWGEEPWDEYLERQQDKFKALSGILDSANDTNRVLVQRLQAANKLCLLPGIVGELEEAIGQADAEPSDGYEALYNVADKAIVRFRQLYRILNGDPPATPAAAASPTVKEGQPDASQ